MEDKLKVASFNVQSFRRYPDRGNIDVNFSSAVARELMPDILGLNEVSSGPAYGTQPEDFARITGYEHSFYAPILTLSDRMYGNGLVSRYPISNAEIIAIDDPEIRDEDAEYESRCILKAEIDVLGGITVLVSHFGLAESEKVNAVKKVTDIIGKKPIRTILMGDFNMNPDDKKLIPIREVLIDTAEGYKEQALMTHPADKPDKKIDYIFVSRDFKVKNTYVSEKIGSDHRMIISELTM